MSQPISTRRAKIQENHAKKQALWAIVIAGVVGLIFLLIFIPLLFRLVIWFSKSGSAAQLNSDDTFAPQVPSFPAPAAFQNTTNLELQGFTEAKATVFLIIDEQERNKTTAGDDGAFSFSEQLSEGEHKIYMYAKDEAENESQPSTKYTIMVDITTPQLMIERPDDGAVFSVRREQTLEIKGMSSEPGYVYVNASRIPTDSEGNFTTKVQLGEGQNQYVLKAEDKSGNVSSEQTRTVTFSP